MKKTLTMITLLTLAACGGTASNNPPDVAGHYSLVSTNCSRDRVDSSMTVTQNGNQFAINNDPAGSINNNGEFSISTEGVSCNGQFQNDTFTADCTIEGVACQVVYKKGSSQAPNASDDLAEESAGEHRNAANSADTDGGASPGPNSLPAAPPAYGGGGMGYAGSSNTRYWNASDAHFQHGSVPTMNADYRKLREQEEEYHLSAGFFDAPNYRPLQDD